MVVCASSSFGGRKRSPGAGPTLRRPRRRDGDLAASPPRGDPSGFKIYHLKNLRASPSGEPRCQRGRGRRRGLTRLLAGRAHARGGGPKEGRRRPEGSLEEARRKPGGSLEEARRGPRGGPGGPKEARRGLPPRLLGPLDGRPARPRRPSPARGGCRRRESRAVRCPQRTLRRKRGPPSDRARVTAHASRASRHPRTVTRPASPPARCRPEAPAAARRSRRSRRCPLWGRASTGAGVRPSPR